MIDTGDCPPHNTQSILSRSKWIKRSRASLIQQVCKVGRSNSILDAAIKAKSRMGGLCCVDIPENAN